MTLQARQSLQLIDKVAILLSSLCLIHCLILPFAIIALPFLGFLSDEHRVHQILIGLAIPVTSFALFRSGNWRNYFIMLPAIFGILLLLIAAFIIQLHEFETHISVIGACCLAFAHFKNSKVIHKRIGSNCEV